MNIIIMGPQASGKGTISRKLKGLYGFDVIGTGDLIRVEIKKGTAYGKELENITNSGNLVPDDMVLKLLKKEMKKARNGFILDGYPRNLQQANELQNILIETNQKIDLIISLDVNPELVIERLSGRRVCPKCGELYNIKFLPPKIQGICDKCGKGLIQRDDDKEEAIKKRLALYEKETTPILKMYEKSEKYVEIDASRDIEEVIKDVQKCVDEIVESEE